MFQYVSRLRILNYLLVVKLLDHASNCVLSWISQSCLSKLLFNSLLLLPPKNSFGRLFDFFFNITVWLMRYKTKLLSFDWRVKFLSLVIRRSNIILFFRVDHLGQLQTHSTSLDVVKLDFKLFKLLDLWLKVHFFHFLEESAQLQVVRFVVFRLPDVIFQPT